MKILKKNIKYLDSASTTKVDERVLKSMFPYFTEHYGNASSNHAMGRRAKEAIELSRQEVSKLINANLSEIIFTSGATESINLAIKGFAQENQNKGNHIITLKTEHKAVLATCEYLETIGFDITYMDVNELGLVDLNELEKTIKKETILISIMHVNNEIGVIQPINKIGKIAKKNSIAFFCDATQAVGKVLVDVEEDNIDMLCFSGHKINGPKGIGILYKRKKIQITPQIHGGGQENGLRGGTYNTPFIVGLGKACQIIIEEFDDIVLNLLSERKKFENYFESNKIGTINFKNSNRAPHILSISLNNYNAEEYLMIKSKELIASTGSACNSELMEPSHVLRALNIDNPKVIRISY